MQIIKTKYLLYINTRLILQGMTIWNNLLKAVKHAALASHSVLNGASYKRVNLKKTKKKTNLQALNKSLYKIILVDHRIQNQNGDTLFIYLFIWTTTHHLFTDIRASAQNTQGATEWTLEVISLCAACKSPLSAFFWNHNRSTVPVIWPVSNKNTTQCK